MHATVSKLTSKDHSLDLSPRVEPLNQINNTILLRMNAYDAFLVLSGAPRCTMFMSQSLLTSVTICIALQL